MAGRWYFRLGSSAHGPVTLDFLVTRIQAGQITANHLVRDGESEPWEAAGQTPELCSYFSSTPAPAVSPLPAPPPAVESTTPVVTTPTITPLAARKKPNTRAGNTHPARRSTTPSTPRGLVIGIAIGGVAVLLLGAVVTVNLLWNSSASTTVAKQELKETNDVAADEVGQLASAALTATERATAIESVSTWREAGRTKAGLKDIFSFSVERVTWETAPKPHCRIQLRVTNTSSTELAYPGWNAAGATNAWLAKPDNTFLAMATGAANPRRLAPGRSVDEVLEFAIAKPGQDELRLVLPYAVVEREGYAGYRMSADLWREKASAPVATTLAATTAPMNAAKKPADSKPPTSKKPPAAKKPESKKEDQKSGKNTGKTPPPAVGDAIPSRDSLQGQIMEAGVPEE